MERRTLLAIGAPAALAVGAASAMAQHAGHGSLATAPADTPSNAAFRESMERMHRDMAVNLTGNPDRDFAAAMIPHHQGAIDMARVQLQYGRDPTMRRLAENVIREQEHEIAELRTFLARAPR